MRQIYCDIITLVKPRWYYLVYLVYRYLYKIKSSSFYFHRKSKSNGYGILIPHCSHSVWLITHITFTHCTFRVHISKYYIISCIDYLLSFYFHSWVHTQNLFIVLSSFIHNINSFLYKTKIQCLFFSLMWLRTKLIFIL